LLNSCSRDLFPVSQWNQGQSSATTVCQTLVNFVWCLGYISCTSFWCKLTFTNKYSLRKLTLHAQRLNDVHILFICKGNG
jgi:uncharacterized membrane protein YciS (DUF1049 family)